MTRNNIYIPNKTRAYLDSFTTIRFFDLKSEFNSDKIFKIVNSSKKIISNLSIKNIEISDFKEITSQTFFFKIEKEIDFFNQDYYLLVDSDKLFPIHIGMITNTKEFDERYDARNEDLGVVTTKKTTTFKIWSPVSHWAKLKIKSFNEAKYSSYDLVKKENGVFEFTFNGKLYEHQYYYEVYNDFEVKRVSDPYATASYGYQNDSVVVDHNWIAESFEIFPLRPIYKNNVDLILYELHLSDFLASRTKLEEDESLYHTIFNYEMVSYDQYEFPINYLVELGITHIQVLPIFDFGSVDESSFLEQYNWGYDPVQFNVLEGSYFNDLSPTDKIITFRKFINALHELGIGFIMDVVYNHVYKPSEFSFNSLVPYYFNRYNKDGSMVNDSGVGNDVDSAKNMVRKFIVDSAKYWVSNFKIDGFRFDLLGLMDLETALLIKKEISAINPNFIFYGEGWDMVKDKTMEYATMFNAKKMGNFAFFNDKFRKTIKGEFNGDDSWNDTFMFSNLNSNLTELKEVISGSVGIYEKEYLSENPNHVINYIQVHDGKTFFDWIEFKKLNLSEQENKLIAKTGMILTILSQGIPLIHSGQELYNSKRGMSNTYSASPHINAFRWDNLDEDHEPVKLLTHLIKLRTEWYLFRLKTKKEIKNHISIDITNNILTYILEDEKVKFSIYSNLSSKITMPVSLKSNEEIIINNFSTEKYNGELMPLQTIVVGTYKGTHEISSATLK
ncbi:pullulanase [Mycoplasma testudineum]|uniref:Pullulanase n=1 Tax=Mycoplasma testudineum TaxID=244584 RepID=A0A4R6IJG2_9MOLU|nr:alpha-amylase family glycosyl hydrolase [Mycoplasma testudineum]OYD26442.1 hypothetical protein CG473_03995 [Mycoplasma testudineum]TDO22131.1 pullulanase [Mycoplasma testudineum]